MKRYCIAFIILFTMVPILGGCSVGSQWDVTVESTSRIAGLDIEVSRANGDLWRVEAKNNTRSPVSLIWDESSYISTEGNSSRLIRGKTRVIHSGQTQPASPIPPNSLLNEVFIREDLVGRSNSFYSVPVGNPDNAARIYLIFDLNGKRTSWTASIRYSKPIKDPKK